MEESFSVHPRLRYLRPCASTFAAHSPESFHVFCFPRKPARHTDDGNRHEGGSSGRHPVSRNGILALISILISIAEAGSHLCHYGY